ncbi:MAG TPA: EAL domain-containing protein [Usitatibacter sp.]|nr:EAL domain-containing protein [Usitatibacter sp.]
MKRLSDRELTFALLVGVAYWSLASYSLALPVRSSGISYIWPADGLALGALLCFPRRSWPSLLLAVFLGNAFASNKPLALNLLYSSFNVFEPWLVATVVTAVLGVRPAIGSMVGAFRFLSLTMAVMAIAILITNTIDWTIHRGDFSATWQIWYLSNTVGMLVLAPLLVAVSSGLRESVGPWSPQRGVEAAVLLLGLAVVMYLTFAVADNPWLRMPSTPMMVPALFLIWASIRFALPGGTLALALFALMAFWYTARGLGPIATSNPELSRALIHLQLGLMLISIAVILVSAVATEWRRALAESRATRRKLDRALESARLALLEVDVRTRNVYLSEGWGEMIGAPRGESYAAIAELLELVHPDDRDALWELGIKAVSGTEERYEMEHRVRCRDGRWIWVLSRAGVVERDASGAALRLAGTVVDISERKLTEQRLHYLATRDALTDLTNRALFGDSLRETLDEAARWKDRVAVISLGLDRFTAINDSLGQEAGNLVLRTIAKRLTDLAGSDMSVARPGGDEFLVLVPGIHSPNRIDRIAESIRKVVAQPIRVAKHELVVTASIGVAIFPDDADSAGLLIRNADIALHSAKAAGRNVVQYFAQRMNVAAASRLELEGAIRRGLERDEFVVHYQAQVDLATGATIGYEALARWQHPERGFVHPKDFIPVADATGLLVPLGERILAKACLDAARWQRHAPCRVSVNMAASQLRSAGFVKAIEDALASSRLDPRLLELEITEDSLIEHGASDVAVALKAISDLGVQIAVDDFGIGYSSLAYLRRLPIDTVKIDRSFITDLPGDADAGAIVGAIIVLSHKLGLTVVAEGVETQAQADYLRDQACDLAQGFLFAKPQAYEALWAQAMTGSAR